MHEKLGNSMVNVFYIKVMVKSNAVEIVFKYRWLFKIEIINNKARHNLVDVKYHQMVFRWVGGAVVGSFWVTLGRK